jgi:hypothetical protein
MFDVATAELNQCAAETISSQTILEAASFCDGQALVTYAYDLVRAAFEDVDDSWGWFAQSCVEFGDQAEYTYSYRSNDR